MNYSLATDLLRVYMERRGETNEEEAFAVIRDALEFSQREHGDIITDDALNTVFDYIDGYFVFIQEVWSD